MDLEKLLKTLKKDFKKDLEKKEKEFKKMFKSAQELGLQNGDMVIFKDADIEFIDDSINNMLKYKNIAEVKRPVEWETVSIRKPRRIRKTKKEDK
jgi:hypothetical protein